MKRTILASLIVGVVALALGLTAGFGIGRAATISALKEDMASAMEDMPSEEPIDDEEYAPVDPETELNGEQAYLDEMRDPSSGWQEYEYYDDASQLVALGDYACMSLQDGTPIEVLVDETVSVEGVTIGAAEYQITASATNLCPETLDRLPF